MSLFEVPRIPLNYVPDGVPLGQERTQQTERAHEALLALAREELGGDFSAAALGEELRIYNRRNGLTVSVLGQSSSQHGLQGTHKWRITHLREGLGPALLLCVQGSSPWTGWGAYLGVQGVEPKEARVIQHGETELEERVGWTCRSMEQLCAVDRVPPETVANARQDREYKFSFLLPVPTPDPTGALF